MKLAVFGDVHENLAALEAALNDAVVQGADDFVCLGDVSSFGPQPRETLARTKALGCPVVMGNADWELLDAPTRAALQASSPLSFDIASWCAEQLDEGDRAFVRTFQKTVRLKPDGLPILCFHGSPRSYDDIITATTPDETLAELFGERAPLMFGGHTHVQLLRRYEDVVFVNPGSVGLPRDGDPRAAYAVIDDDRIELKRAAYPVEETLARIDVAPWPQRARDMMSHVLRVGRLPAAEPGRPTPTTADDPGDVLIDPDDAPIPV